MRVLLLSAYAAGSHVHWREQLAAMLPDWQFTVLELPPRHFNWRVRGNPLYWSLAERDLLEADYNLVLATSMVDLATLRGLVPSLAQLPSALYFHENQFAYPVSSKQQGLLEAQMVSLYAALAADRLLFNSGFNRDSFLEGVNALMQRLPDRVPAGVAERLRNKAAVLPVPIDTEAPGSDGQAWFPGSGTYPGRPLRLLWPGRFEYDKGGDQLLLLLQALEESSLDYQLALVGQQFRQMPAVFDDIETRFPHRIVHSGYLPNRDDYRALLAQADIVVSTALHEFQGLAVLEAVARGCLPLLPARQAYPELVTSAFLYPSCEQAPEQEAAGAVAALEALAERLANGSIEPPSVERFTARALAAHYREQLSGACVRGECAGQSG
jgi:glycosyltransferase involved in cell wall biosynthesis